MTLNNEKYTCNVVDTKSNIFKKATWDYKVSLANQLTETMLTIKIQTTWFGARNSEFRAAKGEIESNQLDTSLLLTGLFFFEMLLKSNDESV